MVGCNNSVSSKLTEINPHLVTVKRLPYSLHKCAEKSCDVLPRFLDYMVKESHNWFSLSTKRNIDYNFLHKVMTDRLNPKKIPKGSGMRWLARLASIEIILDQWDSLKLHFNLARTKERADSGFKAIQLYNMYNSPDNKLYLLFLRQILRKVVGVNKLFQSEDVKPFKLLKELNNLLYNTLKIIVVPACLDLAVSGKENLSTFEFKNHLVPVTCINFGYSFNNESVNCNAESVTIIKHRCRDFLIKLCEELQSRTPNNIRILEKLNLFSPEIASRQYKESIVNIAQEFQSLCDDMDAVCEEWELLYRLRVTFNLTDEYWTKVSEEKNAGGEPRFKHISQLALSLLSLPFSNASVERAFSILNIIKEKLRNKLSYQTADAILRVRYLLNNRNCTKFQPTERMLQKFRSETVYEGNFDNDVLDAINGNVLI